MFPTTRAGRILEDCDLLCAAKTILNLLTETTVSMFGPLMILFPLYLSLAT